MLCRDAVGVGRGVLRMARRGRRRIQGAGPSCRRCPVPFAEWRSRWRGGTGAAAVRPRRVISRAGCFGSGGASRETVRRGKPEHATVAGRRGGMLTAGHNRAERRHRGRHAHQLREGAGGCRHERGDRAFGGTGGRSGSIPMTSCAMREKGGQARSWTPRNAGRSQPLSESWRLCASGNRGSKPCTRAFPHHPDRGLFGRCRGRCRGAAHSVAGGVAFRRGRNARSDARDREQALHVLRQGRRPGAWADFVRPQSFHWDRPKIDKVMMHYVKEYARICRRDR